MSKELETLERLKDMIIGNGVNDNINDYVDNLILPIKQALQRLESIDNANPSEALECLDRILHCNDDDYTLGYYNHDIELVKQALLKSQEPKQYLKWEDLDFTEEDKEVIVRMGDNVYTMTYRLYKNEGVIRLEDCQIIYLELFAGDKKFFNDLHLERVEE